MRLALLLVLVALSACFVSASIRSSHVGALNSRLSRDQLAQRSIGDIQPQWLTQQLDHQSLTDKRTFQQKYYVNDSWFVPATPRVFFMLGGEGPISPHYVTDHFYISTLAREQGALLVALEHRFYGDSVPGNDSSVANLQYLSSAQALEDLIAFHDQIATQYGMDQGSTWVIFGGSYSGSLSAWARLKYPHLFAGSFSASAPVEAVEDFSTYFDVVATSIGAACESDLASANQAVSEQLSTSPGRRQVVSEFNLCGPPNTPEDASTLFSDFSSPIAGVVQYANDNNAYQPFNIETMCSKLAGGSTPLAGLIQVWNDANAFSNQTACSDISYETYMDSMQGNSAGRSWTWQTCTEFGYFQTGESSTQPFSSQISLKYFLNQCQFLFNSGQPMEPNTKWINDFYGGNMIVATNTVFTNGDVDPWHKLGNYQKYDTASQSDSILIHGTAHCADMYPPRASDAPGLTAARMRQVQLLTLWLAAAEKNTHAANAEAKNERTA